MRAADLRGFGPVGTNGSKAPCPLAVMDELRIEVAGLRADADNDELRAEYEALWQRADQARAAVAELVAADREYNEAREALSKAWNTNASTGCWNRFFRAEQRRDAAIAAFSEMKP